MSQFRRLGPTFLFFSLLLLFEHVLPFDLSYSGRAFFILTTSALVFLGLGLGQTARLLFEREKERRGLAVRRQLNFSYLGLWLLAQTILISLSPGWAWIPVILSFAGFGWFIGSVYESIPVRSVVLTLSTVGVLAAVFWLPLSALDTKYLKLGATGLFFLGDVLTSARVSQRALAVLFLSLLWYGLEPIKPVPWVFFGPESKSFEIVSEPRFSPMLRTEVVREIRTGRHFIMTNGSRLALIATSPDEAKWTANELRGNLERAWGAGNVVWTKPASALVIGAAGGRNVAGLLEAGFERVVAVDINPRVFEIVNDRFARESGSIYRDPRVETVVADGRRYLESTADSFDLIFLESVASGGRAGMFANLFEASIYTVEAVANMYRQLKPGGVLYMSEYRFLYRQAKDRTLLGLLAASARCRPEFAGAEVSVIDTMRRGSPRHFVEGTVPAGEILTLRKPKLGYELSEAERSSQRPCGDGVTDDRPYFSVREIFPGRMRQFQIVGTALAFLILILLWRRRQIAAVDIFVLIGSGASYTLWLTAVTGALAYKFWSHLVVTPVVLVMAFLCGLLAFSLSPRVVRRPWAIVFIFGIALICLWVFSLIEWSQVESAVLRTSAIVMLFALPFVVLEMPFLALLGSRQSRADVVAFENLGAVVGVIVANSVVGEVGYRAILFFSVAVAGICSIVLFSRSKS